MAHVYADQQKFFDAMLATAEVARLQAEVARLQAEAMLVLLQRANPIPNLVAHHSIPVVAQPTPAQASSGGVPAGMIICEQVGSISVADWEAMSDARLRALDGALRTIVERAMISKISWNNVGLVIQEELATVGFVFNKTCDSVKYHGTGGWKVAEDKSLPDLVRLRGAARDARSALGTYMWVDEMMRIAVRLMELRGT